MAQQKPDLDERMEQKRTSQAEKQAQTVASQQLLNAKRRKVENPEFLAQLTDPKLESDKYAWLKEEMPGLFARANFLAQRDQSYEKESKWLNRNRVERKIIMHSPGRLLKSVMCGVRGLPKHPLMEIAQRVHGRTDKDVRQEFHVDDRQAMRHGAEVATNFMSNAVEGSGRKAVSESTAVSKVEKEAEEESAGRRVAAGVWG